MHQLSCVALLVELPDDRVSTPNEELVGASPRENRLMTCFHRPESGRCSQSANQVLVRVSGCKIYLTRCPRYLWLVGSNSALWLIAGLSRLRR